MRRGGPGQDARDLAMFRIQMTVIGVLVFVTFENVLWPKSTRRTVRACAAARMTTPRHTMAHQ